MLYCQEHLSDKGPCSASWDLFTSLVSICLVAQFTHKLSGGFEVPLEQYFYWDTISRRIANQE